jgi:hypothetical protein
MDQMNVTKRINQIQKVNITAKQRIKYLLEKYSLKVQPDADQSLELPEPDQSNYLDEDPNFLPFYASI